MKRKRKLYNSQISKTDVKIEEKLIPIILLSIFIAVILIVTSNVIYSITNKNNDTSLTDLWQQAFQNLESTKIGISFNEITTSEEEYSKLRSKSNEFIESQLTEDTQLDIKTVVDEITYVDNNLSIPKGNTDNTDEIMTETGPLYFQDMLIIRYVNSQGKLKINASVFADELKRNINVVKQSELQKYNKITYKTQGSSKESISEEEYLSEIGNLLDLIFSASSTNDTKSIKKLANKYFTSEGRKTVIEGKNQIKLKPPVDVNVLFISAGKSEYSIATKNRIYAQLSVKSETDEAVINIVLKMNSNGRIFDVDIL